MGGFSNRLLRSIAWRNKKYAREEAERLLKLQIYLSVKKFYKPFIGQTWTSNYRPSIEEMDANWQQYSTQIQPYLNFRK